MASGRFVTFCYARIDVTAATLTYANAGHNPPLLIRRNGAVDKLSPGGTVLGVFAESTYEQGAFALRAGDRLILYTDGITEGRNAAGDELGEDGIAASASRHRELGADDMLAAMLRDVEAFNGGSYEDDATMIVAAL
jgi:sigma-B regulation protein RsbU (phosphoserine phosphatase)